MAELDVRQARDDDYEAIAAFTRETWGDRFDGSDYIPDIYHEWIAGDGPDQRTLVADAGDDIAGLCQVVMLSDHEAWGQGMRVNSDFRGEGVSRLLNDASFDWARERGATVCRNMVFSWNTAGLGASRAVGFDPCTEFRWAHVDPERTADERTADGGADLSVVSDPDAAWSCWQRSDARDQLRGLTLDPHESWALSECTRERFAWAADETAVFAVQGGDRTRATAYRVRDYERGGSGGDDEEGGSDGDDEDSPERWVEYGVGAWTDLDALGALFDAVAEDAAKLDADRTRLLVPETVRHVSDAVRVGADVGEHADFCLEADLSTW